MSLLYLLRAEVIDYTLQIDFVLSIGLDPNLPLKQAEELGLQKVQLAERYSTDVGQVMVAVKHIVVKLRGD